jgi:hypothetical protein
MNLLCISDFNQDGITARRGEACWFLPTVAHRLLDSWPACWAVAPETAADEAPATAAIEAPPLTIAMCYPLRLPFALLGA